MSAPLFNSSATLAEPSSTLVDSTGALVEPKILKYAVVQSFVKLSPRALIRNPVMLTVMICAAITAVLTVAPHLLGGYTEPWFNGTVCFLLLVTVLFGNFAEALAEGRGQAQADHLSKSRRTIRARKLTAGGKWAPTSSEHLKKGDVVLVKAGEWIPGDGEIVEGLAAIDESAITGESNPVIKGIGTDNVSVTGTTVVKSNEIVVRITAEAGDAFIDQMIALVTSAKRQRTPNEKALHTLISGLNVLFIVGCALAVPAATYAGYTVSPVMMISLLVCLIPTTIAGLLSAIGISGMDRVTAFNVIAKSGKAVEVAGDVHTVILDKTGTITFGNRRAHQLLPVEGVARGELLEAANYASYHDKTPEGQSTFNLASDQGAIQAGRQIDDAVVIAFDAATRMSGTDLKDGRTYRKGAVDAVVQYVLSRGGVIPDGLDIMVRKIAVEGGTPLAIAANNRILGVVYLKDTVKPGIKEEMAKLRAMGIKTIMCTGDNKQTAATIAMEAGVDEFVAEVTPRDKLELIRREHAQGRLVAMTGDGTNDAPALAQADVGMAMHTGTPAAKEAANMVDLDSNPTKIIQVIAIGKQMLITRGAITTFSISNDVAKYFAILPAMFVGMFPQMEAMDIMNLTTPVSAVLSALIFNTIIIPMLIPLAMKGVSFKPRNATELLSHNMLVYGLGGVMAPFLGIKMIDIILAAMNIAAVSGAN
jgi:K+-transporting ATPase ATPase B chain